MDMISKEKINRICSIAILVGTFVGVISYFLPFADFFITYNYFEMIDGVAEGYVPVFFSAAAFVLAVILMKHDGSFWLLYICGAAEAEALCNVFVMMNADADLISMSDIAGAGYTVFLIAHCIAFIACVIYRFAGTGSDGRPAAKPRPVSSTASAGTVSGGRAAGTPHPITPPASGRSKSKATGSAKKLCPSCGANVDSDALFCPYCGSSTAAPKASTKPADAYCPTCGAVLPSGSSVCPRCSHRDKPPVSTWKSSDLDEPTASAHKSSDVSKPPVSDGWYISDDLD